MKNIAMSKLFIMFCQANARIHAHIGTNTHAEIQSDAFNADSSIKIISNGKLLKLTFCKMSNMFIKIISNGKLLKLTFCKMSNMFRKHAPSFILQNTSL